MRPSEEIALVLSDIDLEQGVVSINKARVAGIDRDCTKTGEDRCVHLCPRALAVLKSHLALRSEWVRAGKIHHAQVFVQDSGDPIRLLNYPYERWRQTLWQRIWQQLLGQNCKLLNFQENLEWKGRDSNPRPRHYELKMLGFLILSAFASLQLLSSHISIFTEYSEHQEAR